MIRKIDFKESFASSCIHNDSYNSTFDTSLACNDNQSEQLVTLNADICHNNYNNQDQDIDHEIFDLITNQN